MPIETLVVQGENLQLTTTTAGAVSERRTPANPERTETPPFPLGFDEFGIREGYSGDGYLDINGGAGPKAFFTVDPADVPAGVYQVTVRGAAFGNRNLAVEVNGVSQGPAQNFNTVDWNLWQTRTFDIVIPVAEGPITIMLVQPGGIGPNIDAVALHEVGTPVTFFAPEINSAAQFDVDDSGTVVGRIEASDESDFVGTPSALTYALSGPDALLFEIDIDGNLSFIDTPDFDNPQGAGGNAYAVTVEVSDGVETTTQDVTVNVSAAVVEPTFDPVVISAEDATIPEGAATLLRSQLGNPENNTGGKDVYGLWPDYSGTGYYDFNGNGSGIDGAEAITFEVTVTDAGQYDLHVRMMNVTNRPLDIGVNGTLQVAEANFDGSGFGNWLIRDAITLDLEAGLNTVTLALPVGGNNGPNVDAIAITAVGAPAPTFPGPNTPPVFDMAPTAVEVAENTTDVADFTANDDDFGTVSFSLSGPDAELFTISETGSLSFIDAPDFETPGAASGDNTYTVSVTVSDDANRADIPGTEPQTVDVVVTVTDIVEDEPASSVSLTAVAFDEDVPGAIVATVSISDPDTIYSAADLVLDDPSGLFMLVDVDGGIAVQLLADASLDFEATERPEISVSLGELSSAPLILVPTDVSEGPRQVLFDGTIVSYSGQDRPATGNATPSGDAESITLAGNLWKRLDIGEAFDVTETSTLQVDIAIGALPPEIVIIGFDDDESPFEATDRSLFSLAGTQNTPAGLVDIRGTGVPQADGSVRFEIDLSGLAGRSFNSIIVAADDDNSSNGLGSVTFFNVFLSDGPTGATENSAPTVVGGGIADFAVDEGGFVEVDLAFVDADGDDLAFTFEVRDQNGAAVPVPSLAIADNVLSGSVPNVPGIYTVTVTANDGNGGINSDSFVLTVNDVNDAPELIDAAFEPFSGAVGTEFDGIDIGQFVDAFADQDGDTLELIVSGLPAGLSLNEEGVIVGIPLESGTGSFTIVARDPSGAESAPLTIVLNIEAPQLGDAVVVEAEDFTGLDSATNFFVAAQPGASENQLIRVNSNQAASVTTQLFQNGIVEGYYRVAMDVYDETDGTATFSLRVGDVVLAENATFDALGTFAGNGVTGRGNAGQSGNAKTISFDQVVFVDADTILTLTGQADGELLRTDRLVFTRVDQPNAAPEAISLSNGTVLEASDGAIVGDLSAVDPDGDDAVITFTVAADSPFEVQGTTLKLKAGETVDFEVLQSIDVTVTATDAQGVTSVRTLTISVTDVNEAPTDLTLVGGVVDENAAGAVIGTLGAIDPEDGTLTFSVSDPRFIVEGATLRLADGVLLDAEAAAIISLEVTATDGMQSVSETFDISVADVNEAPFLAEGAALEDITVDFAAGQRVDLTPLGALDPEGGAVTYGVRSASAQPLPAGITIEGTELVISESLPSASYAIEVFASDGTLTSPAVALTVTVGQLDGFFTTLQLGDRDPSVTILDTDRDGGGAANVDFTQVRDASNPEPAGPGKIDGLWPGFNGNGYLDLGTDAGDAFSFVVNVPAAGDYVLDFRFNQGSAVTLTRPMTLQVNDAEVTTLQFPSNGDWTIWQNETATVSLTAGANVITLTNTINNGPNFDQVTITSVGGIEDTSADADDVPLDLTGPVGSISGAQADSINFNLRGVDADVDVIEISFDGGVTRLDVSELPDSDGDFVVDGSLLPFGTTTATIFVTDGAGNEASDSLTFVIGAPSFEAITVQAEDATIVDLGDPGTGPDGRAVTRVVDAANPDPFGNFRLGSVGEAYVDFGEDPGDSVTFSIDVPAAGTYLASIRYANGVAAARPLELSLNGGEGTVLAFETTATGGVNGWENWTDLVIEVDLVAGSNTVALAIPAGGTNGPNIDQITIAATEATPAQAQRFVDVIKVNFEPPASGNGSFNAPVGYQTPDGFEADTGAAFGDRGNGFSYGWVDVDEATGTVTATPLAQPTSSLRFKGVIGEASDLQQTYAHFELPGGNGERERAWEIALANGTYELTVAIGDTAGQYDSTYLLNVEGAQFGPSWNPVNLQGQQLTGGAYNASFDGVGFRSYLHTGIVQVTDGRLTLDGIDGVNVEIQWLDIQAVPDLTPGDGRTADLDYSLFVDARAASTESGQVSIEIGENGDVPLGIDPTSDIVVGVQLQAIDHRGPAVDFTSGVKLVETLTGIEIPVNVQITGGADSLTVRPLEELKEFTSYTFSIEDVLDLGNLFDGDLPPRQFQDYSTTFVTGATPEVVARDVAFEDTVVLNGFADGGVAITSIDIGPDGKFYASSILGQITRWDLNADGTLDKASAETLALDYFSDTGRSIIGMIFDPEDPNVIWVSDNAPVPRQGKSDETPDFSGQITKITLGSGGSFDGAVAETYITGLPRSGGDHVTNSLEFRANPDAGQDGEPNFLLYFTQGSNSAAGERDPAWGFRPERLLNAAVLEVDPTREAPEGGFDVQTEPYDVNTNVPTFRTDDPFNADGTFAGFYNPFAEGAVLRIFGEGVRNAYDLVWHSNGQLYVPTNGTAGGGYSPDDPNTPINEGIGGVNGVGGINGPAHRVQFDYLFTVEDGGYYGHPNPLLGNYILNGGNPTAGPDFGGENTTRYAVGIQPDEDYDVDGIYSLGFNKSPNGATEYTGNAFGANLKGAVLFVQFSQGDNVRVINVDPVTGAITGDDVLRRADGGEINEYIDPLDIIENPATGQLYLSTLNRGTGESLIILLNPVVDGTVSDTSADEDGNLALVAVNINDPANVVYEVLGLDDDIRTISVAFNGGTAQTVTLDDQNRFTANVGATTGTVNAVLTVADDAGNAATAATSIAFTSTEATTFIDAVDFTILDTNSGTIVRLLDNPATHELNGGNDANGDGLNDNFDGRGYLDPNGGAEDKASFTFAAAIDGPHTFSFRMASANDRSIVISNGSQVETIVVNTGSFTNWLDYEVVFELQAGVNTILLTQPGGTAPNIDSVTITRFDASADEDGNLTLAVIDASDPGAVVLEISGIDEDVTAASLTFNGRAPITVAPVNGQITLDSGLLGGVATVVLSVTDDATNLASTSIAFALAPNANADIALQSLDPAFYSNRLHFNYLEVNDAVGDSPRDFKDLASVRISNTGTEDLEFFGAEVTGPFSLVNPNQFDTLVLAAGQSVVADVRFDGALVDPVPTDLENGVQEGSLRLFTNDAEDPISTLDLAGFWQAQNEGGQEPNLNEIFQLFGFGNFIEGLSLEGGGEGSVLNFFDLYVPADETEILTPYWRIADGVTEAKFTQIAAFHGAGGAALGIHGPGNKTAGNQIEFGNHDGRANQSILPTSGGEFFTQTITAADIPTAWRGQGVFGIEVADLSTDPRLNGTGAGIPTQGRLDRQFPGQGYTVNENGVVFDPLGNEVPDGYTVRVFQALDTAGNVIPNTYLIAQDYTGINYDYQDNVILVEGIAPVPNGSSLVVSNLDDAAADDRLVFTNIELPANNQQFRNEASFTLSNPGFEPLVVNAITVSGDDAGSFQIVGAIPASIAAGGSVNVTVRFVGVDGVDNGAAVLHQASLNIETGAGNRDISLAGLAQLQSQQGEEPTVAQIVEAFGYSTDVAQGLLANGGLVETVGDEVLLPYLQRLDATRPVEVINLAAFLQQGDVSRLNIHGFDSDALTELFASDNNQGQTVLPDGHVAGNGNTGSVARASFSQDAPFGIKVTVDGRPTFAAWSDPEINKADDALNVNNGGHYIRFFEAKDADGNVIAGTYIGIQDYPGGANFDYNDSMFLVRNVQGYTLTAAEDANDNGIIDALETDLDADGIFDFFDDQIAVQRPFSGTAPTLTESLTVDAITFDTGGQGIAWNDDPGKNGGNGQRPDADVETGGGGTIIFVEPGEWVEYTINVATAGTYDFSAIAKAPTNGATIALSIEDGPALATVLLPDSNGAANTSFTGTVFAPTAPVEVDLEAGTQVLRLTFGGTVGSNGYALDLDGFTLNRVVNTAPVAGTIAPQAANEDAAFSFNAAAAFSDPDGDTLSFTAANLPAGLSINGAGVISGTPTVDGSFNVTITANDGDLTASTTFTLSVAAAPVSGQTPFPGPNAPGFVDGVLTVQAANYDSGGQGVAYNDAPGLQGGTNGGRTGSAVEVTALGDIGWITNGEWLEYTINVAEAGTYNPDLLMAFGGQGTRSATVSFYGIGEDTPYASTGPIANPNSGGWTTYQTRDGGNVDLEAGTQIVRVTFNGGSQDFRSLSLTQVEITPQPEVIGETGSLTFAQTSPDQWFFVEFTEDLDNPSVVVGPPSFNDTAPANIRVRNVTSDGFEFQLDEWDYLDGVHGTETVSWIAVESGTHTVNGLTVVAGVGTAAAASSSIGFGQTFDAAPVVFAQVTSVNDSGSVTDRLDAITQTGFNVELHSQETDYGTHGTESLSWIAFEAGGGAGSGLLVGKTPNQVNQTLFNLDFEGAFEEDQFAFIADMQTENGRDTASLRLTALNQSSASFFVEEETSQDAETNHINEEIGFIALNEGLLFNEIA